MATPLDECDQRIISLLREDGRMSIREVAERAHISRANAYARIERLRRDGVITGFTATVDPHLCGYDVSAYVALKLKQQSWKSVRRQLEDMPEVEHAALVAGDFDILMLVRAGDTQQLRNLVLERLQGMPEVVATQTMFIFDET